MALYRALSQKVNLIHMFNFIRDDAQITMSYFLDSQLIKAQAAELNLPLVTDGPIFRERIEIIESEPVDIEGYSCLNISRFETQTKES